MKYSSCKHALSVSAGLLVAGGLSLTAGAQTNPGTNQLDPAMVSQLLQRLNQLEQRAKKVDDLEAEVKQLKAGTATAEPTDAPVFKEAWPQIQFSMQGDVDYYYGKGANAADRHNTFFLGDLDPLVTAKLSEKASVLGDFAITSDNPSGDGFNLDVERLQLEYDFNDYFHVEAGRFNTDIGYYNNVYHNGSYFQTTVARPSVYDFEDSGGLLPVHGDGLSLNGDIPSGSLNLHYTAELVNGRNYDLSQPAFSISDNNDFKAFNVALAAKPDWAPGFQIGGSAYHDTVTTPGVPRIDQLILTAYEAYHKNSFEWLTEGVFTRQDPQGGQARWTPAGYSQVSRKFGKFRPYVRMEWQLCPTDDPLWKYLGENQFIWGPTIGVRFDFTQMMALKFEYEHDQQGSLGQINQLTMQWTFRY